MELHQLRYLLAVVDEGTFSAAAQVVRISQSGVSTQIQKLERELGVALIDRSPRRVALTPAGARLVPYVRAAVAAVADVTGAADEIRGLVVGSLRVGTVMGLAWPPLFDALAAIHARHPGIDLRLHEANSDDLLDRIRDGTVDVAVAAWSGEPPDGVRSAVVVDDALAAAVAPGHPWTARTSVRPVELAGADLISLPPGTGARTALDDLLRRLGSKAYPRWEVSSPGHVRMLVSRNLGVGVISATTAESWPDVVVLGIDDDHARSRLGLVWRDRPSHPAQALLRLLVPRP